MSTLNVEELHDADEAYRAEPFALCDTSAATRPVPQTRLPRSALVPLGLVSIGPIAVAATLSLLSACGGDFDPGSRIDEVRILAVRADAPYAAPGERVQLEALAVDPEGRPLTWGFGLCIDPMSSTAEGCIDAFDRNSWKVAQEVTIFDVDVPDDVISRLPPAGQPRASVGAIIVACPGELAQVDGAIPFRCTERSTGRPLGTDEYVVGVKRIFARATDRNENPIIDTVTWDGAPWPRDEVKDVSACDVAENSDKDCPDDKKHHLALAIAPRSVESGVDSLGISFREQVVAQYYATEGIFEHDTRLASDTTTTFTARRQSAGQTIRLWFVVRDDRGGVTWEERRVRVAP
jgi:hypothetical protein